MSEVLTDIPIREDLNALAVSGWQLESTCPNLLEHALDMTGRGRPKVLIVPSAKESLESHDEANYRIDVFFSKLGVVVEFLHDFALEPSDDGRRQIVNPAIMPSHDELENRFGGADLIWGHGGNSGRLLEIYTAFGMIPMIDKAISRGAIFGGNSAGAVQLAKLGHSDAQKNYSKNEDYNVPGGWRYSLVEGLGYIDAVITPHFDGRTPSGARRQDIARQAVRRFNEGDEKIALIGIDDHVGLEITAGGLLAVIRGQASGIDNPRQGVFIESK